MPTSINDELFTYLAAAHPGTDMPTGLERELAARMATLSATDAFLALLRDAAQ